MIDKKKKIKILTILSIILFDIGLLLLGYDYLNKNISKNNSYNIENKTYYEVTLNSNNYYDHNIIGSNKYYIGNSIKSIDIYFNYYLKNNSKENINYSYDIEASLKSYADNGTKLIWEKDFNLDSTKKINQKEIIINKIHTLDYQYYVNYVKSFQEYYHLKTETYLYIKLNINIDNTLNPYILLTIPINENVIEINMQEDNSFLNINKQNDSNKKASFIIITIAIIILVISIHYKNDNENTLLKNYQDIIITTENKPFINSNKIIYLTNLKDLINIAINYNINIFNYHHNYYLIKDNTYYIYILKT